MTMLRLLAQAPRLTPQQAIIVEMRAIGSQIAALAQKAAEAKQNIPMNATVAHQMQRLMVLVKLRWPQYPQESGALSSNEIFLENAINVSRAGLAYYAKKVAEAQEKAAMIAKLKADGDNAFSQMGLILQGGGPMQAVLTCPVSGDLTNQLASSLSLNGKMNHATVFAAGNTAHTTADDAASRKFNDVMRKCGFNI